MFREMRRFKQQISREECVEVLKNEPRGVLALSGDNDYPYAVPVNFYLDEDRNRICFHGATEGHRVDAAASSDKASFCVLDEGFVKEDDWALNIRSVIVFGRIRPVSDPEESIGITRKIAYKYYPDKASADEEVEKDGAKALCMELVIEHMSGKLVCEK